VPSPFKGQGSIGAFLVLVAGTAIIFPRLGRWSFAGFAGWIEEKGKAMKCQKNYPPVNKHSNGKATI